MQNTYSSLLGISTDTDNSAGVRKEKRGLESKVLRASPIGLDGIYLLYSAGCTEKTHISAEATARLADLISADPRGCIQLRSSQAAWLSLTVSSMVRSEGLKLVAPKNPSFFHGRYFVDAPEGASRRRVAACPAYDGDTLLLF